MGPNTAFCLVVFGVFGIYCEFIWPGRVWQLLLGCAAACAGGYFLGRALPSTIGLELLGAAFVLFLFDAYVGSLLVVPIAATVAMASGFVKLIAGEHGIHPLLAAPWCFAFGGVTAGLNWAARRARRNKRIDL